MAAEKKAFDYVNDIWSIADYVRDVIRPADYNKLILPFAVLRRFECALEPTRDKVLSRKKAATWDDADEKYCLLSGYCFYNLTGFRLGDLGASRTYDALMEYIGGFSENAREVLLKFKMENTCKELDDRGMLYEVCTRFSNFNLGPDAVPDRMMSDIYEHLIERYGEEISQDAEDFMTPRDVVRLATSLVFANEDSMLNADNGEIVSLYDGSCGTCGFISDALEQLDEWHERGDFAAPTHIVPFGQELEPATWAMGKAALMLRNISGGSGDDIDRMKDMSEGIRLGDTLSEDAFPGATFDYQLTNPPYGKKWEREKEKVEAESALGFDGRFGAGTPSISDGSMLFVQNVVSKMTPPEQGGGKAAIILSGSPLFNGGAGSGPSNIRRWLFDRDVVDCIVKLPTDIFFRTGITTYIWVFNNRKPEGRRHKIQLIDASERRTALRKTLGKKSFEVSEEDAAWVVRTYVDGHDHGKSVIVDDTDFMFRAVATKRPLRAVVKPDHARADEVWSFAKAFGNLTDESREVIVDWLVDNEGKELLYDEVERAAGQLSRAVDTKTGKGKPSKAKMIGMLVALFGEKSPDYGVCVNSKGETVYDPDLGDVENVPWGMDFDEYMESEVLPFAPDAEVDESVVDSKGPLADGEVGEVGTSISFNRYFYEYERPRDPEAIAKEILELESGLDEFMRGFLA